MSRKKLLNGREPQSLQEALYDAAHRMRGGVTALSLGLPNLSYNTLNHKLNPLNDTHFLKPVEIEQILRITEDSLIVDVLAQMIGCVVFKPEAMGVNNKALKTTGCLLADMGDFMKSLASGAEDDRWELHEVTEIEKQGRLLIKRLLGVMAGARQAYEREFDNE